MSINKYIIKNHPVFSDSVTGVPLENINFNSIPDIVSSNAARISRHGMAETHTVDPQPTDDSYDIGGFWKNTATRRVWCCLDNTPGNAVWVDLLGANEDFVADFYVDPNGNDSNDGRTIGTPFLTIGAARDAIRAEYSGVLDKDITVAIRGGEYRITTPVEFNTQDSAGDYTITYLAYPGEKPVFKGSTLVTGTWVPDGNRFYVDLPGQSEFSTLYANGQMAIRARVPSTGFYWAEDYPGGLNPRIFDRFYINPLDEPTGILPGEEVNVITVQGFTQERFFLDQIINDATGLAVYTTTLSLPGFNRRGDWGRYFYENSLSFLDSPNEWFFDTGINRLYYYPPSGTMSGITVEVPQVNSIFNIFGDENRIEITGNGSINFSCWFKTPVGQSGVFRQYTLMQNKQNVGSAGWEVCLRDRPGSPCTPYIALNNVRIENSGTTPLNDDNWHHLIGVVDKNTNRLYTWVDGVKLAESASLGASQIPTDPPTFGYENGTSKFSGYMDEILLIEGDPIDTTGKAMDIMNRNYNNYNVIFRMSPENGALDVESDTMTVKRFYSAFEINNNTASVSKVKLLPKVGINGAPAIYFDNALGSYPTLDGLGTVTDFASIVFEDQIGVPVKNIIFDGITWTQCDYAKGPQNHFGDQYVYPISGAIEKRFTDSITIKNCEIHNVNCGAIVANDCARTNIINNDIHHIGYHGIFFDGPNQAMQSAYGGHLISNNHIYNIGSSYPIGSGISTCQMACSPIYLRWNSNSKIINNHCHDASYVGIRNYAGLAPLLAGAGYTEIAYNHIYNCMNWLFDGAGILTSGRQRKTHIHHNHIHDNRKTSVHGTSPNIASSQADGNIRGIYCDEGSDGVLIEKNLVYDVENSCVFFHLTQDCHIVNNKLINPLKQDNSRRECILMVHRSTNVYNEGERLAYPTGNTFINNILQCEYGAPAIKLQFNSQFYLDSFISGNFGERENNLFSDDRILILFDNLTSITGDIPYFQTNYGLHNTCRVGFANYVDYKNKDFRLAGENRTLEDLGFEEFEVPDYRRL